MAVVHTAGWELVPDLQAVVGDGRHEVTCYWNSLGGTLLDALQLLSVPLLHTSARLRFVYRSDLLRTQPAARHAAWQRDHGIPVRHAPSLPPGAMVVSPCGALLDTRTEADGYAVVRHPGVLEGLSALAGLIWARATPLDDAERATPSEAERRVLGLLNEGRTDAAIARRLGVSERTVRRTVAQLMARLGAASRFHAGVRAVEDGWV